MKKILLVIVISILTLSFGCKSHKGKDSVAAANVINKRKADNQRVDSRVAEFLVTITDGRLMDSQEGELAIANGTSEDVREYGRLMVRDQQRLLSEIKRLAIARSIELPSGISNQKKDGLRDLTGKTGKDFDEKFIKMMIIDHERDVNYLKDVLKLSDQGITNFASQNLPIIESHLAKINAIKDKQ